ncbi:protein SOB FIVE-LIKE 1 [Citrus sinensis]|nr:protein SOB FIVE-LIKE 1 [Citrus sinensis]
MEPSKILGCKEECSSSASGWTMYIGSPAHENDNCEDDDDDSGTYKQKVASNNDDRPGDDDDDDDKSDDSMASDASSGPSYQELPLDSNKPSLDKHATVFVRIRDALSRLSGLADGYSRISLFHGNVLQPLEAKLVRYEPQKPVRNISLEECDNTLETSTIESAVQDSFTASRVDNCTKRNSSLSARDIICAFNYSRCCLHKRADLVLYFKHVLHALSKKGSTSSEQKLRLQRRFANFTVLYNLSKHLVQFTVSMPGLDIQNLTW